MGKIVTCPECDTNSELKDWTKSEEEGYVICPNQNCKVDEDELTDEN